LAGCGSAGSSSSHVKAVQRVAFKSAAVGTTIPALYTCDGKNISPPLEWGSVPADTGELVLFAIGFNRTTGTSYSASIAWAVSGVNPQLHRLAAGHLPPGAHLGVASDGRRGYSICPKKGTTDEYQFELYALPRPISVSPNFAGPPVLDTLTTSHAVAGHGLFVAAYKRA
jgi:phosphatidylethanolamine-binding protein (PEBP) family uncharacterized protein